MKVGQNADKKSVLDELLQLGMVLVAIDARADGVDVPNHLGVDPQLRLNLSWRFGRPMDIDDWGIFAELTFSGAPYPCKFPWDAIFLIVSHINGESYLFPDHVPKELLHQAALGHEEEHAPKAAAAKKRGRPALSLVQADDGGTGEDDDRQRHGQKGSHGALGGRSGPLVVGQGPKDTVQGASAAEDNQDPAAPKPHGQTPSDGGKAQDDSTQPPGKPAKSRGHLRLVK